MTEGIRLDPHSISELEKLGRDLKGAEKIVQKHLRAQLRAAAKPLAETVIREGASHLPKRGGLAARVAAGRGGLRADLFGGRSVKLSMVFTDKSKDSLKGLDEGLVRHPVYGNRKAWVSQSVPSGAFTRAFEDHSSEVRLRVRAALIATADELARKA